MKCLLIHPVQMKWIMQTLSRVSALGFENTKNELFSTPATVRRKERLFKRFSRYGKVVAKHGECLGQVFLFPGGGSEVNSHLCAS